MMKMHCTALTTSLSLPKMRVRGYGQDKAVQVVGPEDWDGSGVNTRLTKVQNTISIKVKGGTKVHFTKCFNVSPPHPTPHPSSMKQMGWEGGVSGSHGGGGGHQGSAPI